jgi:type III restriction enzyme
MGTAFSGDTVELNTDPDKLRDQEVVYWVAKEVLSRYYRDENGRPMLERFTDVRRIAQQWFDSMIDVVGETDPRYRRMVRHFAPAAVVQSVYAGIEAAAIEKTVAGETHIIPLLNRYNPEGSSAYVRASTARPVYPTKKSHVNLVVADTDSWEQIAAKTFEQIDAVQSYVKNAFLGFEVPYVDKQGTERKYLPDFLCRVKTPDGELFNLIVEITGFAKDKELKRYFMQQRWLPAVNAQRIKTGGLSWHFVEITDIERIKNDLTAAIERICAEIDHAIANSAWAVIKLLAEFPDDMFPTERYDPPPEYREGLIDE